MRTVKKTVVLPAELDVAVRKVWAVLIDKGIDATYSTALNAMLVAATAEASGDSNYSPETWETVNAFLSDHDTIDRLNLDDMLGQVRACIHLIERQPDQRSDTGPNAED